MVEPGRKQIFFGKRQRLLPEIPVRASKIKPQKFILVRAPSPGAGAGAALTRHPENIGGAFSP